MNENHDDQGRFSSAGSASAANPGLMQKIKDFAGNTSGKGHIDHAAMVPAGVKAALSKERFVNAVPPGSTRDRVVKEAATWAKMGLEKTAALALGGPVAAALGRRRRARVRAEDRGRRSQRCGARDGPR